MLLTDPVTCGLSDMISVTTNLRSVFILFIYYIKYSHYEYQQDMSLECQIYSKVHHCIGPLFFILATTTNGLLKMIRPRPYGCRNQEVAVSRFAGFVSSSS